MVFEAQIKQTESENHEFNFPESKFPQNFSTDFSEFSQKYSFIICIFPQTFIQI